MSLQSEFRLKPKPVSLQRRFTLLQAATLAVVLLLLAAALFFGSRIQETLDQPFEELHTAMALNLEFEAAVEGLRETHALAHRASYHEAEAHVQQRADELNRIMARYQALTLAGQEPAWVDQLDRLQKQMVAEVRSQLQPGLTHEDMDAGLARFAARRGEVELLIDKAARSQVHRVDAGLERISLNMRWLYVLLLASAGFAFVILRVFRHTHRRHLWEPLEALRQKVLQVRRGDLDVRGEAPDNVELRPLMESFYKMADEVREMRDRLEQKVLERTAKLEEAQQQLLRAAKLSALGQLVAGVAHEVNNPLTSILGFSEVLLSRSDLDPKLRSHARTIRDEALRLKNAVANLTSFSAAPVHHTARLDLRRVLERLAEMRRYQLQVNRIRLHYEPPPEPLWVRGDADQLLQVFFSIVLNAEQAIRSTGNGGDIWLTCSAADGRVTVAVRDNGPGMPREVGARVFDPFFTTRPRGTGMGLTVARDVMEHHQGEITVESGQGQGSIFTVRLPLAAEAAAEPAEGLRLDTPSEPAAAKQRALVVDDEAGIAQLVSQVLSREGWECATVLDPREVEAVLAAGKFGLVVCDLKMPGHNGLEVLRLLRARYPALVRRFLLMTGDLAEIADQAGELEGITVLRKPFTIGQLLEAVRQMLAGDA